MPRKLILRNLQCPGDVLMLTAAVRDLHKTYPDEFLTDVRTYSGALWDNNPYITPLDEAERRLAFEACLGTVWQDLQVGTLERFDNESFHGWLLWEYDEDL